jgi:hypothetical protein
MSVCVCVSCDGVLRACVEGVCHDRPKSGRAVAQSLPGPGDSLNQWCSSGSAARVAVLRHWPLGSVFAVRARSWAFQSLL